MHFRRHTAIALVSYVMAAVAVAGSACTTAPSAVQTPQSPSAGAPRGVQSPAEIAERSTPAVVSIHTENALGTGFIVAESGLVATNLHVVAGNDAIKVTLADGREFRVVEIWNGDKEKDLIILRIEARGLPVLALGDSTKVHPGDAIVAIGHPLGLEDTVSNGLVSAIRKVSDDLTILQISAPIAQGSSGGPIFNDRGEVIGVSTAILTGGQNLNFGVPVKYLKDLLASPAPVSVEVFTRATQRAGRDAPSARRRTAARLPLSTLEGCAPASIALLVSTIGEVIDLGANLYNDGNVAGCYHLYEGAASDIERRIGPSCRKPAQAIAQGRKRAARLSNMNERAWAMRDTFEGLLDVIDRVVAPRRTIAPPGARRGP